MQWVRIKGGDRRGALNHGGGWLSMRSGACGKKGPAWSKSEVVSLLEQRHVIEARGGVVRIEGGVCHGPMGGDKRGALNHGGGWLSTRLGVCGKKRPTWSKSEVVSLLGQRRVVEGLETCGGVEGDACHGPMFLLR
jgi:hypothetical protein